MLQRADGTLAEVESETERCGGEDQNGKKLPHDIISWADEFWERAWNGGVVGVDCLLQQV